jgi:CRISPR-associated protein (TIGR03986 family)
MSGSGPKYFRIRCDLVLESVSDVHVGGDGVPVPVEEERLKPYQDDRELANKEKLLKAEASYIPLFTRSSGGLALPAATLRGFLRRQIDDETTRTRLFGREDPASEQQQGGVVRIMDALPDASSPGPKAASYWHPERRTALRHGIAMNAAMGVQDGSSLFYHEVWPSGSRFRLTIYLDRVDEGDFNALKEAISRWDGDPRHNLGRRKRKSWGILRVAEFSRSVLEMQRVLQWFEDESDKGALPWSKKVYTPAESGSSSSPAPDIPLEFRTLQPLLINDPGQVPKNSGEKRQPGDKLPSADHFYYRNGRGLAAIPAETMIGGLRALSERLLATWIHQRVADSEKARAEAVRLTSEVFGATGRASRIQWQEAVRDKPFKVHYQHFIAIDRFTGGVSGSKLYTAGAVCKGVRFVGGGLILHHADRWTGWQKGLLYVLLEEIRQTGIWLGWGKSKGYGRLQVMGLSERLLPAFFEGWSADGLKRALQAKLRALHPTIPVAGGGNTASPWKKKQGCEPPSLTLGDTGEQRNPYGFVPVKAMWNAGPEYRKLAEIGIRHDLFLPERCSGRITCGIETVTPVLVGNEHEPVEDRLNTSGEYIHRVHGYASNGRKGFPANSLRGMIGSTLEILSQSSLRVLEDSYYSVRKIPGQQRYFASSNDKYQALTALGELVWTDDGWGIRPLTLPVRYWFDNSKTRKDIFEGYPECWKELFRNVPEEERHPIYFKPHRSLFGRKSYGPASQGIYWAPEPDVKNGFYKKALRNRKIRYLSVFALLAFADIQEQEQEKHIPGYLRYFTGKNPMRHWGIFVPQPSGNRDILPVPPEVWQRFERLNSNKPPELPKGYEKFKGLQEHMLLYFDIEKSSEVLRVSDMSFNAVGREEFSPNHAHAAFGEAGGQLLPWGSESRTAQWLTPAEAMLGIVEEASDVGAQRNLASRLRFTDALFDDAQTLGEVKLPILASPKPPSPFLYFHKGDSGVQANGRKVYLRHSTESVDRDYIRTHDGNNRKTNHQKLLCDPLLSGQNTSFEIHFSNLSREELGLLLRAIEPGGEFTHLLGLGKPLGMGAVKVNIEAMELRDYRQCPAQWKTVNWDKYQCGDLVHDSSLKALRTLGEARPKDELITYPLTDAQARALRSSNTRLRAAAENELFQWHTANRKQKKEPLMARVSNLDSLALGKFSFGGNGKLELVTLKIPGRGGAPCDIQNGNNQSRPVNYLYNRETDKGDNVLALVKGKPGRTYQVLWLREKIDGRNKVIAIEFLP